MPNWVHQSWTHALRIPIDVCRNQIPPLGGTLKYPPICPPARKLRPTVSQECPTQYLHACPPAQAGTFLTLHLVSPSPQAIQPRLPTKGEGSSKGAVKGVSSKGASRGSSKGFQGVVKGVSRGSSKGFIIFLVWSRSWAPHFTPIHQLPQLPQLHPSQSSVKPIAPRQQRSHRRENHRGGFGSTRRQSGVA